MPNLLINGDLKIWPRGESFTITGDEAFHYTAAKWCVYAATGQTVKVNKTSDGLTFSGTSAIMQRMLPLKVGQKYIFLAIVDDDVKTLQITGGTYTENSFLKYNKTGSYEQLQIKSNGNTKLGKARLWKGTTVYPIIEEDEAVALMRSEDYVQRYNGIACIVNNGKEMKGFAFRRKFKNEPVISYRRVLSGSNVDITSKITSNSLNEYGLKYFIFSENVSTVVYLDILLSCEYL